MHSFRRAVLRSVATVSVSAPASAVTAPLVRSSASTAACRSAAGVAAAASATSHIAAAARFFSQTARAANATEQVADDVAAKISSELSNESAEKTAVGTSASAGEETPYGVFVRNIVFDATEEHLKEAFTHYGPVTRAAIARDARGLSRGYGFVWYKKKDDQEKAIQEANGMFWHGRQMTVTVRQAKTRQPQQRKTPSTPRQPNEPTDCLYIGNLPYETTDADLNEIFRSLKGVEKVRVAVDQSTGWPRGFAHCDFATVEDAINAKEALTGRVIGQRELRLDFANVSQNSRRSENAGAAKASQADADEQ